MRKLLTPALAALVFLPLFAFAQDDELTTLSCTFVDGKSMNVSYKAPATNEKIPNNAVWLPGGHAMSVLTEAPLKIGGVQLPMGGYNLYLLPSSKKWTLIVSKGVKEEAYDQKLEIVRVPMDSGTIPQGNSLFTLFLNHTAPSQCSIRIDFGKTGYFADFAEDTASK